MAVDESLGAYSSIAVNNTPAGTDTVGPDLDDHIRDEKKNTRIVGETSQGPTAPAGFLGRQRLATSATASNTLTWQMHDGGGFVSVMDIDTSGDTVSRWYARKGSMPGEAMSGTLSGVSVVSSFFDGSATGTFRGFFTGSASGRFTGDVRLEDGSSATPSMAYVNDTDTGRFLSATGAMTDVVGGVRQQKFRSDNSQRFPKGARFSLTKSGIPENATTDIAKLRVLSSGVVAKVDVHIATRADVAVDDHRFGVVEYSFLAGKELGAMFFTALAAASVVRAGGNSPIPSDLTGAISGSTAVALGLTINNNGTSFETTAHIAMVVTTNSPDDVSAEAV